ncbi:MAG: RNA 2'-phosphotransferase [Gammaproteobacteria bacterium]|nr:RNA 2'-phosphotransferase [Gammaproteobacteria bacterium]
MKKELKNISKYLSFILRHKPETIGLELNANGWAAIDDLITKTTSMSLTKELIQLVVENNDKQRFAIDSSNKLIRAHQGHSIGIDLNLKPIEPPKYLFHGTAECFERSILINGLNKQKRHHVHLTESKAIAKSTAQRHGKAILFKISSQKMHQCGYQFYQTTNSVWLVNEVPAKFMLKII